MHRITTPMPAAAANDAAQETVLVDKDVPRGFAPVRYHFSGYNTAYNEVSRSAEGYPTVQTEVDLIFASGTHEGDVPDGVTVEGVLAAVDDRLQNLQKTPNGSRAHMRASALIRKAIETLTAPGNDLPEGKAVGRS